MTALARAKLAASSSSARPMPRPIAVVVALAAVYILWGSTAPAIKIAVSTIPPWWLAGLRFALAGTILWAWSRARGVPLPTPRECARAALTGFILLVVGNGVFSYALQYIPSGIGALFFALAPLFMAIFAFAFYRERLSALAVAGIALGFAGMVFLYSPSGGQHLPAWPTILGAASSVAWAVGSILQRRSRASDVVQMSALQMLFAAVVLVGMALVSGEHLSAASFAPAPLAAFVYLVVFGSVVGFSAFLWLLNNVSTTLASTYSYVNPLVSLALGIGFLGEPYSWRLGAGAAVIVAGVAVMALAPRQPRTA
ncbi:MAG: drug/metabolite exporter YedA [Vulcanimicrobiaceae bacterium]